MYISLYSESFPDVLREMCESPEMMRLSGIGMHCGCDYTSFPIYKKLLGNYDRLTHSIGVASIVWHFTGSITESVAGLLHDIATPVFAHTIDFMNNDYEKQESTEVGTRFFIENSDKIMSCLKKSRISIDDVCDYHKYPIADNDTPRLSADRLEYTLGNAYLTHNIPLDELKSIYNDLFVAENEDGTPELCFKNVRHAVDFFRIALKNSTWFVSEEDIFPMQYLADLMKKAFLSGVIEKKDLYSVESAVIGKFRNSSEFSKLWEHYRNISSVASSPEKPIGIYSVKVSPKMRYIDPLVMKGSCPVRVSSVSAEIGRGINSFLNTKFERYIYEKKETEH